MNTRPEQRAEVLEPRLSAASLPGQWSQRKEPALPSQQRASVQHGVGWTSPVGLFPWDLKSQLPTCGRELIAETAAPYELALKTAVLLTLCLRN